MPILGTYASSVQKASGSFESIATAIVGAGGAPSVTFNSIPSTYKHLQIRAVSQQDYATGGDFGWVQMRFNGDSGSNYDSHLLQAPYQTGAYAITGISFMYAFDSFLIPASNNDSRYAVGIVDVLDYASTSKYKTSRIVGGANWNGGTGIARLTSGLWNSTSAISSITLIGSNGNFKENSKFALYGMKGQ